MTSNNCESGDESGDEFCENATKNPTCPYVTMIHRQDADIKQIKRALVGDNLQGGLVAEVQKFKLLWKATIFILSVTITILTGVALEFIFH